VAAARSTPVPFDRPSRVAVLVLENRSYDQVIGNPEAPYLNGLARRYALATSDCNACDTEARSLVGQLDAARLSWKTHFEDLTSNRRPGPKTASYDSHYNPFVYYEGIRSSALERSRVVDFDELRSDLRRRALPRFSWIAPGVLHDGHYGSLREADRYASELMPQILRALGPSSSSRGTRGAATGAASTARAAAATSR
jgi:acid phosphatase